MKEVFKKGMGALAIAAALLTGEGEIFRNTRSPDEVSAQELEESELIEIGETKFKILPNVNPLGRRRVIEVVKAIGQLTSEGKIPPSSWQEVIIDGGEKGSARSTTMIIYPFQEGKSVRLVMPDSYAARKNKPEEDYQLGNLAAAMVSGSIKEEVGSNAYLRKQDIYRELIMEIITSFNN